MTRAGTRRRPDAPGVRRASREFGAKARGYGSRSQAAADRRARDGRDRARSGDRDRRSPWRRQADRSRRLIRFGARHKAGLLGWAGILSALTCMWAFTGVTQLVTVGVSLGAAGGGAAIRHHQRNRTMNHGGSRRAKASEVRAHHDAMVRTGRPAAPEPAGDTVTVRSHTNDGHGVKTHTRRKAGAGTSASPAAAGRPVRGTTPTPGRTIKGRNPNSNADPDKLRKQGKCPDCADRGLWTSFGTPGEYRHVTCPRCGR